MCCCEPVARPVALDSVSGVFLCGDELTMTHHGSKVQTCRSEGVFEGVMDVVIKTCFDLVFCCIVAGQSIDTIDVVVEQRCDLHRCCIPAGHGIGSTVGTVIDAVTWGYTAYPLVRASAWSSPWSPWSPIPAVTWGNTENSLVRGGFAVRRPLY